jgi:hypothetical protein
MTALSELTSFLWWLMLLSTTAIILHDIGSSILPKTSREVPRLQTKVFGTREDEVTVFMRKIRRGLQRPSNFRAFQREAAQTIVQAALAARGMSITRIPESRPELLRQILKDPELIHLVEESDSRSAQVQRGRMLAEFNRVIALLEKAEVELK